MIELFENFLSDNPITESPCKNGGESEENGTDFLKCNTFFTEKIGLSNAFVPFQTDYILMEKEKSLTCGTVFERLIKPYKNL